MGCSVTCTTAVKESTGRILVNFSDGTQVEYASLADAYDATYALDSDPALAKKWLLARWLKADPGAANPGANINGKTCTLNVGAYSEVQVV